MPGPTSHRAGDEPSGSYTYSGGGGTRTKASTLLCLSAKIKCRTNASALVEHEANTATGTKQTSPLPERKEQL